MPIRPICEDSLGAGLTGTHMVHMEPTRYRTSWNHQGASLGTQQGQNFFGPIRRIYEDPLGAELPGTHQVILLGKLNLGPARTQLKNPG